MTDRRLQILWTDAAVRDLELIVRWIAADSATAARRVLRRIEQRAAALGKLPRRGRVVPELARFGHGEWREVMVEPYRLIYRPHPRVVHVLAVLDARRDLEDLLLERLTRVPPR